MFGGVLLPAQLARLLRHSTKLVAADEVVDTTVGNVVDTTSPPALALWLQLGKRRARQRVAGMSLLMTGLGFALLPSLSSVCEQNKHPPRKRLLPHSQTAAATLQRPGCSNVQRAVIPQLRRLWTHRGYHAGPPALESRQRHCRWQNGLQTNRS